MFKTSSIGTGNGIGRRVLLVALSALLVITTLIIIPGNAYGVEDTSETTTSVGPETDTTVSDTTGPDTTVPADTTTTATDEPAPVTETTTTSMAVEDDTAVTDTTTTTSAVVEEEPEVVTTTTTVVEEEPEMVTVLLEGVPVSVPGDYLESLAPDAGLLAHIPPAPNPTLANTCGLDIAMVFDRSGSVSPFETQFKNAAKQFVDALQGTPSTVGLTGFAGIDGVGGNGIGQVRGPMTSIETVAGANTVKASIDAIPFGGLGDAAGTNWEDGFQVPHALAPPIDVILFLTDGNPTTHNGSADLGLTSEEEDVDAGIFEANIWKVAGTRVIAVGIGDGVTVSNLQDISGPNEHSDYFLTDFDTIGDGLQDLAIASCSSTITITKNVDDNNDGQYQVSDGNPDWTFKADATQSVGSLTWQQPGGANPVSDSVGADGVVLFDWLLDDLGATTDVDITETVNPGWRYDPQTTCTVKTLAEPTPVALPVVENGTGDGFSGGFSLAAIPRDGVVACEVFNTAIEPEIQLLKTVTPTSVATPQTVNYTFTIANTGNIELTNVTLDDPLLTDETIDWSTSTDPGTPAGTLSVGEIVNGTGSLAITQADIDDGSPIPNTATASSTEAPDATDDATVTIIQNPSMTLLKTDTHHYGGDGVDAGDTITYNFTVTNTGNTTLTNITIDDPVAGVIVVGGPIASLAPGVADASTFISEYTITQANIDAGEFENCATALSDTVSSNESCTTERFAQTPSIDLIKDGTLDITTTPPIDEASPGDIISYTFTITNTGNATLTNVTVTDTVGGVTIIGSPIASMAPGDVDSTTYTGAYAITQDDITAGSFTNVALVTGTDPNDAPVTDTDDHTVEPVQDHELSLTKTVTPLVISTPQTVTYDFTIENIGNTELTGVALDDPMLGDEACDWATASLGSSASDLLPGETVDCTGTYDATQADIDAGTALANTAAASSNESPDATDDATVTIVQSPAMTLFKDGVFQDESGDGFAQVGETIDYTFTVTNTGNTTLLGITITDPKVTVDGGPIESLAPAAIDSTTFTATYVINQVDIDAGSFENCGTATDGSTDSNESCTTDLLPQAPSIDIVKTGVIDVTGGDDPVLEDAGDVINYSFVITNTGNVTLTDITLTDAALDDESCDWSTASSASPEFSLIPGETVDCTGSYETIQDDFDAGSKENIAGTTGTPPIGEDVVATDTEIVPLDQRPSVILTKNVTPTVVSAPGPVTYSFTVENDGNVTLTSNTLGDPLPGLNITNGFFASLAPGEINTLGFTATLNVSQAHIDAGDDIVNLARVDTAQAVFDEDDATVEVLQAPALEVLKESVFNDESGDGFAQVGETISYTFTVTNTGNITLIGITLDDPNVTVVGGPIDLAVGATNSVSFTAEHVITQADIDAGFFENCATANGTEPDEETPVSSSESCVTDELVDPSIDLVKTGVLDDTDGDGSDSAGDTINYTFTVTNTGNTTLTDVSLADTVGGVSISGGPIPSLAAGAVDSSTFTGSYVLTQFDVDLGHFFNLATVSGTPPQTGDDPPDPVTDDDDFDQPIERTPDIELFKNGSLNLGPNGTVDPGDVIVYTFTVENTGNTTLILPDLTDLSVLGLDLTCPWDGNPTYELLPGFANRVNCTAEYEVTQADIDAGEVNNCALIEASSPTEELVEAEACTTVDEPHDPGIEILKVNLTPEIAEGASATFGITVQNTGNVTLSDVVVEDVLSPDCDRTFGGILIPDELVFYECTTDDVLEDFTNVAVTRGTPPQVGDEPTPPVTDEDDAPVVVIDEEDDPVGEIGDLVWNDENENGIKDGDEKGIAGATVRLTMPDGTSMDATTNANGIYMFIDLLAGEYTVTLIMDSVVLAAGGNVQVVTAGFFGSSGASVDILAATDDTGLTLTTPGSYTIQLSAGEIYLDADFGLVAVLPVTGLDATTIALIALALLLAGGAAVFVSSRKREDEGDMAA